MADKVKEFWDTFERETGEKVEARCLGKYFPDGSDREGKWGLLVLTDKAFRFRETPSDDMFFGLAKNVFKKASSSALADLHLPLAQIAAMSFPPRGFLSRVFGSSASGFFLDHGGRSYRFESEMKNGFVEALEKALEKAPLEASESPNK